MRDGVPHVLGKGKLRDQGVICSPLAERGRGWGYSRVQRLWLTPSPSLPREGEGTDWRSLLQLAFQRFDLFGECGILRHKGLDLAHGVQDRGVVASPEPAADFRQRTQRQGLRQIHRNLTRANDIGS